MEMNVAFIGLGQMGSGMADNLVAADGISMLHQRRSDR
tara:strand:+ start:380 stop:493 length:114 start_codon:yes stop_codon:yes gene_type:complete